MSKIRRKSLFLTRIQRKIGKQTSQIQIDTVFYLSVEFIFNQLKENKPIHIDNFGTFTQKAFERKVPKGKTVLYKWKFIPHFNLKNKKVRKNAGKFKIKAW